jgi:hypothetical protein
MREIKIYLLARFLMNVLEDRIFNSISDYSTIVSLNSELKCILYILKLKFDIIQILISSFKYSEF